ncbi:hypothetical protein HELRODRAFT_178911 [Helobdella robusta]|uniref:Uncharacterized protein n=1 Tax=Helobdella robusta TaxID=6412 RepID=T1FDW0_HELRO|nr:hypothetical protein HELRODRAFT_178911 [Helobdella robusta]ESN95990.1 hypothetical protein HELRODRAFT_178911 [Helobdella robusta]
MFKSLLKKIEKEAHTSSTTPPSPQQQQISTNNDRTQQLQKKNTDVLLLNDPNTQPTIHRYGDRHVASTTSTTTSASRRHSSNISSADSNKESITKKDSKSSLVSSSSGGNGKDLKYLKDNIASNDNEEKKNENVIEVINEDRKQDVEDIIDVRTQAPNQVDVDDDCVVDGISNDADDDVDGDDVDYDEKFNSECDDCRNILQRQQQQQEQPLLIPSQHQLTLADNLETSSSLPAAAAIKMHLEEELSESRSTIVQLTNHIKKVVS